MSYIPIALTAYILNAISVTVDKFLLTKAVPNPLIYVFYFSLVSCIALVLLPFAPLPSIYILAISSVSTLLWTTGAYFMFKALQVGQVSRAIPIIGTLIPLFLLGFGLNSGEVAVTEALAIGALVLGLVFLTIFDWRGGIKYREIVFVFLSALFFAASYLLLRMAYENSNFWTVFVYSRPILVPVGLILIAIPASRKIIFPRKKNVAELEVGKGQYFKRMLKSRLVWVFASGQIAAGISQLLLTFSISLANPALVNALQGTQYVFLFFLSLVLSKKYPQIFSEKFDTKRLVLKFAGIVFIGIGLMLLSVGTPDQLY